MAEDHGGIMVNMSNDIKEIKEVQVIRLIKEVKFLGAELTKKENVECIAILLIFFLVVVSFFIQYKAHVQTTKSLEDLKEQSQKIKDEVESLKKYQEKIQSNYRPLEEESHKGERNKEQVTMMAIMLNDLKEIKEDFIRFKNEKNVQKEDSQVAKKEIEEETKESGQSKEKINKKNGLSEKNTNENIFGFYGFFKCILVLNMFFVLLRKYESVTKDNANENTIKFHTLLKSILVLITFFILLVLYWEVSKKNANESAFGFYGFLKVIIILITLIFLLAFYKIFKKSKREILFRVDRFIERKNSGEKVFSSYFYSHFNGYKIRLQVYPGGCSNGNGTHLSLFFVICKGEYDNELQWPYKHSITLSIINQSTGEKYKSMTFSHSTVNLEHRNCFNKPINKDNVGYGRSSFISHKDILRIFVNNVVVIKCKISAPP